MTKRSWLRSFFARPVSRWIKVPPRCRLAAEALEDRLTGPTAAATVHTAANQQPMFQE
jgi:hypothetical protein